MKRQCVMLTPRQDLKNLVPETSFLRCFYFIYKKKKNK